MSISATRSHTSGRDKALAVYENRLRRMAERQGLALQKIRRGDTRALDHGTYQLTDPRTNTPVAWATTSDGHGLSLDDVERALKEDPR